MGKKKKKKRKSKKREIGEMSGKVQDCLSSCFFSNPRACSSATAADAAHRAYSRRTHVASDATNTHTRARARTHTNTLVLPTML